MRFKLAEDKIWRKAICMKEVSPRSYIVRSEDGKYYRRNRRDLVKTAEEFKIQLGIPEINIPDCAQQSNTTQLRQPTYRKTSHNQDLRRSSRIRKMPDYYQSE